MVCLRAMRLRVSPVLASSIMKSRCVLSPRARVRRVCRSVCRPAGRRPRPRSLGRCTLARGAVGSHDPGSGGAVAVCRPARTQFRLPTPLLLATGLSLCWTAWISESSGRMATYRSEARCTADHGTYAPSGFRHRRQDEENGSCSVDSDMASQQHDTHAAAACGKERHGSPATVWAIVPRCPHDQRAAQALVSR
jgi:hypothetical protein